MSDHANGIEAFFDTPAQLEEAVGKLTTSGFDRADLSLPDDTSVKSAATDVDARQLRTLGASTAGSVAALAAAGVTIATGGAALPAFAAAAVAGGAVGGGAYAAQEAVNNSEQRDRSVRADQGQLVVRVRATTDAKRSAAEAILSAAGARRIAPVA